MRTPLCFRHHPKEVKSSLKTVLTSELATLLRRRHHSSLLHTPTSSPSSFMPGNNTNVARQQKGCTGTPNCGGSSAPTLSQTHLDNQGRLQPCTTDNPKSKQTEPDKCNKPQEPAIEKRGTVGCSMTRGTEAEPLTRDEIMELPDQDITNAEEGKSYVTTSCNTNSKLQTPVHP